MKRKKLIFLVLFIFFLIGAFCLRIFINTALSGKSISTSLVEYSFEELDFILYAPEDWVLFDVTETAELQEDFNKYKIIGGGQPASGYPWLKVFQFKKEEIHGGNFDTQTIIDLDIERIRDQFELQSLEINDNDDSVENISFEYLTNIVIFQKKDVKIYCRDWIGKESERIFVLSICATEQQWEKLDDVYPKIIQSVKDNN